MSSHDYVSPYPGVRGLPCARCGKMEHSHLRPVPYGTRLTHGDMIERVGWCDGRCGAHEGRPLGHNDLVRLHGRCDGSCGAHQ